MKSLEKILLVIGIASVAMIYLSIPFGHAALIFSIPILTLLYWPFGFAFLNGIRFRNILKKDSYNDIGPDKIILGILAGQSLTILSIGIVFWISRYIGGELLLIVGFVFSFISIILLLILGFSKGFKRYKMITNRLIIFAGIALILYFTPLYFIEKHYDPFSLDKYRELTCFESDNSHESYTQQLLDMNSILDEESNIKEIGVDGNYLVINCDKYYYRINPSHATPFVRKDDEHTSHIEFRKNPGEPRIEMYLKGNPSRTFWEDNTTQLYLPESGKVEFLNKFTEVFCHLRNNK